jgi:predicted ATPase
VDCTQLDVFVYPLSDFQGDYDAEAFTQVYGGQILLDRNGVAAALLEKVQKYVDGKARKTREELRLNVSWCEKMLRRAERTDAEGSYRRHWLLVESLEIYTELRAWPYLGPKKALRQLEKKDREGYALYEKALCKGDCEALADWVGHIKARFESKGKKAKKTQQEGAVT